MLDECYGCSKRTAEPNCHHPDRCEYWARHMERQNKKYEARRIEVENAPRLSGYQKGRKVYTPGTRRRVL